MTIKDLEPKSVWTAFYELSQVPRPSKHEEKHSSSFWIGARNMAFQSVKMKPEISFHKTGYTGI